MKLEMSKKTLIVIIASVLATTAFMRYSQTKAPSTPAQDNETQTITESVTLPKPTPAEGQRGDLGIDANVDETTIDRYLNLENTVYRDVRMLNDPANWEAIGGDSNLSGYIEGFEVVPYPYLAPTHDIPEVVEPDYDGPTLFMPQKDGSYEPVYYESMDILEDLFPTDKNIVLMCGGGGYAGMTKDLLVSLGWDPDKIWNAGGYWYYTGTHGITVKRDNGHQQNTWDFQNVPYHVIDFSVLHRIGSDPDPDVEQAKELVDGLERLESQADLEKAMAENRQLVAYVYLPGCSSCAKFAPIVAELTKSNVVPTYAIAYNDLTDASLRDAIKHAPGVLVFEGQTLVTSLSPDSDADTKHYASLKALTTWLHGIIDTDIVSGEATADIDCTEGCEP